MQDKLKEFVRANREAFDDKEPSPDLWKKIQPHVVRTDRSGKKSRIYYFTRIAAAVLLTSGIGTGIFFLNQQAPQDSTVQQKISEHTKNPTVNDRLDTPMIRPQERPLNVYVNSPRKEIKKRKIDRTKTDVYAQEQIYGMLLDSMSTSNRLEAVLALGKSHMLSTNVLAKLEQMANSDPSTNVRMAAAELWLDCQNRNDRHEKIQQLFVVQDDPTMQVELLQEMAGQQAGEVNTQTIVKLNEIVEDPFALPLLKEQAYAVLLEQYN